MYYQLKKYHEVKLKKLKIYHPPKLGRHRYGGRGDMFLVVDGQNFTCHRLNPSLLFITKAQSMTCSHTQNFLLIWHSGLPVCPMKEFRYWSRKSTTTTVLKKGFANLSRNSDEKEKEKKICQLQSFLCHTQTQQTLVIIRLDNYISRFLWVSHENANLFTNIDVEL